MPRSNYTIGLPSTITTPFELYAWLLELSVENKPYVYVESASLKRFQRTLKAVSKLSGESIPPSIILNEFRLKRTSKKAADAVKCGWALCRELESLTAYHCVHPKTRFSIESTLMEALYLSDFDDFEQYLKLAFNDGIVRIRSRKPLTRRYGVTIDVTMDGDCVG